MPVFVVDREHAIAGAQPPEVLVGLLDLAASAHAAAGAAPAPRQAAPGAGLGAGPWRCLACSRGGENSGPAAASAGGIWAGAAGSAKSSLAPPASLANQPDERFCACGCGAALGAPAPLAGLPPGPPRPPTVNDAELTVLFADLAGYTELSGQLDAEEVHALLERFDRVDGHRRPEFGGSVDKHIGDCVMAVFGAPIAHGNDPERAARAALAIQDAMPALSEELGRPLEVHLGLAAGQVVASRSGSAAHREYTG